MEIALIEALIDDDAFYNMSVECPHCRFIEDEDYTCTTCWCSPNTTFKVSDIISSLMKG